MQSLMEQNTIDENFLNDTNYWAIRKNEIRKQVLQDYKKNPIALQNRSTKKYQQDKLDNQNSFETFSEGFSDSFKVENTPFLGSWIEGNKFKKLNEITAKIYNQGFDSLDYNEQVEFEKYRNELIKQNVYSDSFAYKLGGIALNNAKYVIEYATTQAIANAILPGAGILLTSAIQTTNPTALRNEYWARQLAGDLNITEKGEMFFGNLEKDPIKTFLKSYASLLATNLSEKFGDVLAASTPIKAISNKLTGGYKKMFDLLFVGNGTNSKGIKGGLQSLFNGLVGENVEEYLEQPLRELLGGGEEDYTLENIVKAFDITWDDFLLTNASIVMQGGISNTSLLLANKLKSNKNLSQQDIINYLETQPVEQKEKDLKRLQLAENEAEKQEYEDWQKTQKEVLLKAGATEQEANDQLEIINKFISHGAVNFLDTPTSRINFLKQNNFELQNGVNSLDENKNNQPQGQYNISDGVATLFDGSNFSTPIHEFSHYWRQLVNNFSRAGSEQAKKELDILNKYVGAKNNESWTRSQEEKFAKSFEAYLTKGIAPAEELKPLFQRIKEAMANVYNSIKNLNVSLTPEITKYFDNIFSDVEIEGKTNYQQAYQDLQKEIEDEKKILYQQGLSEEEVNKAIDDKFGERLAKIEAEIDKGREKTNEAFSEKNYKLNAELQRIKKDINNNSWVKDGLKNFFITTGNLLKEIGGEKLFYKLRKLEADTNLWTKQDSNILEPFLTKFADIENKNKDDYSTLDLALKNSDINTIEKIIQKYNMYDDYIAYRNLLDTMREQLINVGVDVGYIENYSPRKVDPNLLEDYLNFLRDNKKETSNILDLELSKLKKEGRIFSEEDRQKYINQILNGEYKSIIGRASNNATKERQIEALTPQQNQFYLSSIETISQMVQQNRKAILQREFFGKENKEIRDLRRKLKAKNKQLKELEEKNAGNIKKNEIIKLETRKKVLEVSLEGLEYSLKKENDNIKKEEIQNKINNLNKIKDGIERNLKFYKTIKAEAVKTLRRKEIQEDISNIENKIPEDTPLKESIGSYVDEIEGLNLENKFKLKEILNAVLNPLATNKWSSFLSNSSFGLALNSIKNAVNQLPELAISFYKNGILRTANTLTSPKKITIEDLGLGDLVFDISKKDSKFFKFLSKYTLLDKFDAFGKNTFINAKLKLTQDLLKQNDNLTNKELDLIFGEQAEEVKENILKGNVNNIDVKSYILIKLSEVQPLFNSDKTLAYLKYPNTRFVYSLKSFAFKQFNLIKNDIIDKISSGNKKEVIEGLRNLVLYQTYIMLIGGGLDLAMNLMGDDDPEKAITDAMLDNIIFMNIINRYMYTKIAKEGGGKAIADYLFGVPILGLFDGITKDIQKAYKGNLDFDNSKTLKFVPFAKDIKFLKQTYENLN